MLQVHHAGGGPLPASVISRVGSSIQSLSNTNKLEVDANWKALFKRDLKQEGIKPDAAKLDYLRKRFQMPYQLAASPGYRDTPARQQLDWMLESRGWHLTRAETNALLRLLKPSFDQKAEERNRRSVAVRRESWELTKMKRDLASVGTALPYWATSADLRKEHAARARFEGLDRAVGRLVASGMFDAPRRGSRPASQTAATGRDVHRAELPHMTPATGRARAGGRSLDPVSAWIRMVDADFNARLGRHH